MSESELDVSRSSAAFLFTLFAAGLAVAVWVIAAGKQFGWFPIEAAITGLGITMAALALAQATLLLGLHQRRLAADELAATSPFRTLLIVLFIGLLLAAGFALTGTELGVFPLESAVAGLGIAAVTLAITTAGIVWLLRREIVQTVVPGQSTNTDRAASVAAPVAAPAATPAATNTNGALIHVDRAEEDQHVLIIEGIGEKYATRLNAHGIITIPQLRRADATIVARQVNATGELVREWQAMAELMQLKGVGPQSAEVLVRAGISSIEQLAHTDPDGLVAAIQSAEAGRKVRIQGNDIKAGTTRRWVAAAREFGGPE